MKSYFWRTRTSTLTHSMPRASVTKKEIAALYTPVVETFITYGLCMFLTLGKHSFITITSVTCL